MPELDIDRIRKMYEEQDMTWIEIAKHYGTYPNKIIRFAKKHGITSRTQAESQALSLKLGKREHPTKGTKRPESTKVKIAKQQAKNWDKMSDDERQRRADIAQQLWENKTQEEREEFSKRAIEGVRKAAKDGSKIEHYIASRLREDNFEIEVHKEDLISGENIHIDIYIPNYGIAIEIDGPAHFLPIWGEETLQKHIAKDARKNATILSYGFTVVRVKCKARSLSKIKMMNTYEAIKEQLDAILNDLATMKNQLYEIEVD